MYFLGWHSVKLGGSCSKYEFGNITDQGLKVTEGVFCEGQGVFRKKTYYCEKGPQKQLFLKCHA